MFSILTCLTFTYLALTAYQNGVVAVHLPAMAVVIAVRKLSPSLAVAWAFGVGLCLDAVGHGPLGVHAAALVAMAWIFSPLRNADERRTLLRVMGAVLLTVLADGAVSVLMAQRPLENREQWMALGIQLATMTFATAAAAGTLAFLGRRLSGASCTTR